MRRTLLFSLSMAAAMCCGLAAKPVESAAEQPSQPPALQEPAHVSPRLNLSLEQRHTIKEIVKDLKALGMEWDPEWDRTPLPPRKR